MDKTHASVRNAYMFSKFTDMLRDVVLGDCKSTDGKDRVGRTALSGELGSD